MDTVIGNFRCVGKRKKGCGSLLRINWGSVFIKHSYNSSRLSFLCPVCGDETNIKYSKYRPLQPVGTVLPTKSQYLESKGIRLLHDSSPEQSDVGSDATATSKIWKY